MMAAILDTWVVPIITQEKNISIQPTYGLLHELIATKLPVYQLNAQENTFCMFWCRFYEIIRETNDKL